MNAKIIVVLLTLFLVAFFGMMATGISNLWKNMLIMITPIVFISAVILVLRDRSFDYPELKEDEEFGYVDRPDLRH